LANNVVKSLKVRDNNFFLEFRIYECIFI
jgi:hypothetical protein